MRVEVCCAQQATKPLRSMPLCCATPFRFDVRPHLPMGAMPGLCPAAPWLVRVAPVSSSAGVIISYPLALRSGWQVCGKGVHPGAGNRD